MAQSGENLFVGVGSVVSRLKLGENEVICEMDLGDLIKAISVSKDGQTIFVATSKGLHFIQAKSLTKLNQLPIANIEVLSIILPHFLVLSTN